MAFDQSAYQEAVQTTIRVLASFANADVVIDDWTILDQAVSNAPYVIIDNVTSARITESMGGVTQGTFELPFTIFQPFGDGWLESKTALRDKTDDIINTFSGSDWSAGGLAGVSIQFVRLEPEIELYEPSIENERMSDPVYIARPVTLEMEIY